MLLEKLLRRKFFPLRDHRHAFESDTICQREAKNLVGGNEKSTYELELETREWLREFKSKTVVAWIALIFSAIALTLSLRSCYMESLYSKSQQADSKHDQANR